MKMRACHESLFQVIACLLSLLIHHGMSSFDNSHLQLSYYTFTGDEGTEVKVDCHAHVTARPRTLKWISLYDQQASSQIRSHDGTSVKLIISSLHRYDAGTYKCLLVTASGDEEMAEVHIFVRPRHRDTQTCRTTQFKCKVTKYCIFLKYRCDGKDDCGDGSDEECQGDPCANRFICNNTRCVDRHFLCDHVDNCGDNSDERACYGFRYKGDKIKMSTTTDPHNSTGGDDDDENYSWVKNTIYTIIASTIGLVIAISIGVILVFRGKMKRIRQRRMVRVLNAMQSYGDAEEPRIPPLTGDGCVEEEPFLPRSAQRYHQGPSIIFNVNNGVQYMPRYRYFIENPPPYSEVQGGSGGEEARDATRESGDGDHVHNTPPPYSTIDRSGEAVQEIQGGRGTGNNNNNNNTGNHSQNPNSQRTQRNRGENNLSTRGGPIGRNSNEHSTSLLSPHTRACEWSRHSESESCTGCVHCVPSSSLPTSNVVSPNLHRNECARNGVDRLNHQDFSQGQGPVVTVERGQQRGNEQYQNTSGNTRVSGATLTQLQGRSEGFRGVNINSRFLQNLLISSSSSSSHNDSQHLTASVDSESSSNGSGRSGASSSSSCSDDSVTSCTLLGVAGVSGNERHSIHETETLKTRERDVPRWSHDDEIGQSENCSLPIVDHSFGEAERVSSNLEPRPNFGACYDNNSINSTTTTNSIAHDINRSSLPNLNSEEAAGPYSEGIDSNENQHLMVNQNSSSSSPQSQTETGVQPVANNVAQNDSDDNNSSNSTPHPQDHLINVGSGHNSNQHANSAEAAVPVNINASSAVLQEVANLDRNNRHKAKQGHLSVHKGQIVLHTSDGILVGQSIIPIIPAPLSPSSASESDGHSLAPTETLAPHLSGELIVKDGNIMFQIPVGKSLIPSGHVGFPCMENITQQQPPSSPSYPPTNPCLNPDGDQQHITSASASNSSIPSALSSVSAAGDNSSQSHTEVSGKTDYAAAPLSTPVQEVVSGGDLNIRDGRLVLEPPKPKTPSSQILSHLHGAECLSSSLAGVQEEEDGMPVGPVVNDKRHRPVTGSGVGNHRHHHQSASKSRNSDIVLPRGKN